MIGRVCVIALLGYTVGDLPDGPLGYSLVRMAFSVAIFLGLAYSLFNEYAKP